MVAPMQLISTLLGCKNVLMQRVGLIYDRKSGGLQEKDADVLDDASLQSDINKLITKVEKDGCLSLDVLDDVLTIISSFGEKTAGAIVDFKSKMIAIKDDSYKLVVKEYLSSSLELLDFFAELEKFLDSARRSHSYIEHAIQQCSSLGSKHEVGREEAKTISNILNNIMASNDNDRSGEKLVKRASCLIERQEELLFKCHIEKEKLVKGHSSSHIWRKLMNYICIGTKCLVYVVLAVMVAKTIRSGSSIVVGVGDLKIKADCMINFSAVVGTVEYWNSSCLEEFVRKNTAMNTMQEGALHSIKEMGEIKILIGKVVNFIESLLASSTDIANGENVEVGIKNIKCNLKKFVDKIKVLEDKTGECSSKILKARQAVLM